MSKHEVFEKELAFIKNDSIKHFTIKTLEKLPDYFYKVAASSSGKYHPPYALGEGGLIRHTRAAVGIAVGLFEMNSMFTEEEKDIIISSLILHDGLKHGINFSKGTIAEHPLEMAKFIKDNDDLVSDLSIKIAQKIINCISSHMGKWNTKWNSKIEILPKPEDKIERFVHMADYLASRKYLQFDFDVKIERK